MFSLKAAQCTVQIFSRNDNLTRTARTSRFEVPQCYWAREHSVTNFWLLRL